MLGPAASHPAPTAAPVPPFPRPRGGSLRSGLQTAAFAALFVTGLDLWLTGQQRLVLWVHVVVGLALVVTLGGWLARHVPVALGHSQRRAFTNLSWALLAVWLALFATGIAMAVPGLFWLAGHVWFPERPVTEFLSLVHFWASWLATGGLVIHLAMRHWRQGH